MRIKWSFALYDKHFQNIFNVKILHSNKDGMCSAFMLQMSKYRGVDRGSRPKLAIHTRT
jgi:hypothetical protein